MSDRQMSSALRDLLREKARVDGASQECQRREAEAREAYRAASEAEKDAERMFKREAARFKLTAPYKTAIEKQWAADADDRLCDLQAAWDACTTLRREMKAATDMARHASTLVQAEYDCVAAALHAYNRELKVELDLAGRVT